MAINTKFSPDNVMVSEVKDGKFTVEQTELILKDVADKSLVLQMGKLVDMNGKNEKGFTVQTDGISAYWVNETEKIKTSKPTIVQATLKAQKLAVIILASRECLAYNWTRFFEDMKPQIVDAFYQAIDDAVFLNVNNPFANSIKQASDDAKNTIKGDINYSTILDMEDKLFSKKINPNAFVSAIQNNGLLRKAVDKDTKLTMLDRATGTLDNYPLFTLATDNTEKGTLIVGDFNNLYYGIPHNIEFSISEDGTISTIKDENGEPIHLFERELIALRATMDIGVMPVKDDAFCVLEPNEVAETKTTK